MNQPTTVQCSQLVRVDAPPQFVGSLFLFALYFFVGFQTFLADNLGLSLFSYTDELLIMVCIFFLTVHSIYSHKISRKLIILILAFVFLASMSLLGMTRTWSQVLVGYWDIYKNLIMVLGLPLLLRSIGVNSKQVESSLIKFIYASILFSVLFYVFPTSFLNAHQEHMRMGIYRLGGLISDVNSYAFVLMLLLFSLQTNFIQISRSRVISAVLLLLIFLTFSRSTLVVAIAGLIFVNTHSKLRLALYAAITVALLSAMTAYDSQIIAQSDRPSAEFTWNPVRTAEVTEEFGQTQYRLVVYLKSFQMFAESPIIGYGLGTFGTPISLIEKSPLYEMYGFPQTDFEAGGFNVQDVYYPILYVQSGLLGLIIFLAISFSIIAKRHDENGKKFFIVSFVSIILLGLNSMTFMVGSLMFFYALFISIADLRNKEQRDQNIGRYIFTRLLERE